MYKRKISKNEAKLEKAIRDVEASSKKVTDLMRAEQEFTQRVESAHTEISKLEQDLAEVDTLISRLRTELIKLGVSQEEVSIDGILESVELELLEKTSASTLFAQLADLQKQRSTLLSSFSKLSAELSTLNAQHTARKHALQQLQASKHSGDLTNTSRQLKERISSLEQEYQSAEMECSALEQNMASLEDTIQTNKKVFSNLQVERDEGAGKINHLISQIAAQKSQRGETSARIVSLGADLCSLKQKVEQQAMSVHEKRKLLSCKSGDTDMPSILKLQDALSANPIPGVYGLLIDLAHVPSKITLALEGLLGSKLFSFVVRDQKAADRLIALNKQIKGGRILVYPLEWMQEELADSDEQDAVDFKLGMLRNSDFRYPDPKADKCIILESHLEVTNLELKEDKYMHRLLATLLKGKVMVPDLTQSAYLARTFDCDCITTAGEIVYAKGFLSKLGSTIIKTNTLSDYLKYKESSRLLQDSTTTMRAAQIEYEDLKSQELQLSVTIQDLSLQKDKQSSALSRLWEELSEYQRALLQSVQAVQDLKERKSSLEVFMTDVQREIASIQSELSGTGKRTGQTPSLSPQQVEQDIMVLLEQIAADKKLILAKSDLQRELQERISTLDRQECTLNEKQVLFQRLTLTKQFRDKESSYLSKYARRNEELVDNLTQRLVLQVEKKKQIKQVLTSAQQNKERGEGLVSEKRAALKEAKLELQSLNQRRFDLQISTDTFEHKLNSLHIETQDEEHKRALTLLEKHKDLELVGKLKELMIAKLKYTQKDKANFEQLERFFQTHHDLEDELKNLSSGKQTFFEVTGK